MREHDGASDAHALLGQQVRVLIGTAGPNGRTVVEGKLLSFSNGGEFTVQDEDGFVHYCWPLLEIEAADDSAAEPRNELSLATGRLVCAAEGCDLLGTRDRQGLLWCREHAPTADEPTAACDVHKERQATHDLGVFKVCDECAADLVRRVRGADETTADRPFDVTWCERCQRMTVEHTHDDVSDALSCAKCRGTDIHTSFHKGSGYYDGCGGSVKKIFNRADGEHLHHYCRGCRYDWTAPTADVTGADPE